jgi:hypothetical protein
MEKPDASDAPRFTDGHGADKTFCRPFVELRACAAGIKFIAWRGKSVPSAAIPASNVSRFRAIVRRTGVQIPIPGIAKPAPPGLGPHLNEPRLVPEAAAPAPGV